MGKQQYSQTIVKKVVSTLMSIGPTFQGNQSDQKRFEGVNGSPSGKKSLKRKRVPNDSDLRVSKKRKLNEIDFTKQPSKKYLLKNVVDTRGFEFIDSDKIVTSDEEGTLQIHKLGGEKVLELKGHQKYVTCLHIRENILLSGGYDNTVRFWDLKAGTNKVFSGHKQRVLAVQYNGTAIASGSADGVLKIWDPSLSKAKITIDQKDLEIYNKQSLFLTEKLLYVGTLDSTIKTFDISSGKLMKTFSGHSRLVSCVLVTEKFVISGSADTTIKVYDKHSGKEIITLAGHTSTISSLLYSNGLIFSGSADGIIKIWNPKTGKCLNTLTTDANTHGYGRPINTLKIVGNTLYSGSIDDKLTVWEFGI